MIILISIIIGWLVILTFVMYQIHEKKFLESYNLGRQHESEKQAEKQGLIHEVRNNYFFKDAYELGRKHAKKD